MATSTRLVSADSHMVEPADLWLARIDTAYKDRAPKCVPTVGKPGLSFVIEGSEPFEVARTTALGKSGEEYKKHVESEFTPRPSYSDPAARLKDQDIDGVSAEVLYATLGLALFRLEDLNLQWACLKIYNDWLANYASHNPKRLIGVALISLEDVNMAVKELERCRKRNMMGAMIPIMWPEGSHYAEKKFDPFWQAAAELEMPLSMHLGSARNPNSPTTMMVRENIKAEEFLHGIGRIGQYMWLCEDVYYCLFHMTLGGVLERFPKLKLVSAENDIGWVPHFMYRMDHAYDKFQVYTGLKALEMTPSEYIRRQVYFTFQDDPTGTSSYDYFGADNYMWASDFPHTDGTWPHSREVIKRTFAGVPAGIKRKILCDNAARLYGIS